MVLDPELISRAIVVWLGRGTATWPRPDTNRLVEAFGLDEATRLLSILEELRKEFFASDAKDTTAGLNQMADVAAEQFRQHHPEITAEAVETLANWYAWAYK